MRVQKKDEQYFTRLQAGEKATLSDAQTTLVVQAESEMLVAAVDHGIIKGMGAGERKCDYLTFGTDKANTHLIELKGKVIDAAFDQLMRTVENLGKSAYPETMRNRDRLDAYIVSPGSQSIPQGINKKERKLASLLARNSRLQVQNELELIQYVKVVPKQKSLVKKNRKIICSGTAPLRLE